LIAPAVEEVKMDAVLQGIGDAFGEPHQQLRGQWPSRSLVQWVSNAQDVFGD
jgi:hypothetical protein